MSGLFQRPSLRYDTFELYDVHKPSASLKEAFQKRASKPPVAYADPQNSPKHEYFVKSFPFSHSNAKSTDSLKDEYISEDPVSYNRDGDHQHLNTGKGLRAAFEARRPQSQASTSGYSGLKGAFISRQLSSSAAMTSREDSNNISDSSSYSSLPNGNDYGYQCTSESASQGTGYIEDQESLENDHPIGYHSIHRLSHFNKKHGGDNLKKAFEARTGGTVRRNLGRHSQTDKLLEKHANIIVSKMEQDEALMEDSPDAEELRRIALRDMPQCLTIKRCVKVKLSKSVSQKSKRKPISCWKMFKYRTSMGLARLKMDIKDLAYSFELWYNSLKKVEGHFGTGVASFFKFLRWLFLVNFAIALISVCFIVLPKAMYDTDEVKFANWMMSDLITGEGYFTNTPMYYGFYTNESISSSNSSLSYSMPHAYFFTMLCIYFVSFAAIGISAARSYRRSFIETEGGLKNVFASKIFCGWDYNIATKDAANLKSRAIYNEIKELISDFTRSRHRVTFYEKFLTFSVRFFMNFLILCLIAGTAYAVWYFLANVPSDRHTKIIVAPVFMNTVMMLLPMFFSFVVRYEDYRNPKVSLYLTLARTFLLGAVTVGASVLYWLQNNSKSDCWETSLAQEFYRMIIFDFFISVACAALLDVVMFLIFKYFTENTYLEFDIAWNTMQIIYNQTLFWVALPFSPILPVIVVVKLFLCWYIRLGIVLFLCKPSAKSWRAAQTTTWFLVLTFLSVMFVGGLVGYIISYIEPSKECGPFRNYEYIYEIVTLGVLKLKKNSTVWTVLLYITKPGVIAIVIIFLGARVYYSRAQANAQKEIVEQCRNMLVWSAKDKEYYYSLISRATKGQWQYEFHDKTLNPELYSPSSYPTNDVSKERGPSVSNHDISSPPSGATFAPSSITTTFDIDADSNRQYSRYKKYT